MKLMILVNHRLKLVLKKRWISMFILVFPIVFYFITSPFIFKIKERTMPIAIVNEDNGYESNKIIERLIEEKVLNCSLISREEAMKALDMEQVQIVYIFTKGFYNKIKEGNIKNSLEIHYMSGNKLEPIITEAVASKLMPFICANEAGVFTENFYMRNNMNIDGIREKVIEDTYNYINNETFHMNINFDEKDGKVSEENKNMIVARGILGFYIVAISLILIFNVSYIIDEINNCVYNRILIANISNTRYFISSIISVVIVGAAMMWPIFLTLNRMENIGVEQNINMGFLLILYFSMLSILFVSLASLVKDTIVFQSFMPILVLILCMLGGAFFQLNMFSKNIENMGRLVPIYNIMKGIDGIINNDILGVRQCILRSFDMLIVYFIFGLGINKFTRNNSC